MVMQKGGILRATSSLATCTVQYTDLCPALLSSSQGLHFPVEKYKFVYRKQEQKQLCALNDKSSSKER